MKIVLASTSPVKIEACKKAFADKGSIEIITVKVPSGVNEQPMNDETIKGAKNRLDAAIKAVPDADYYISIENGIFEEDGRFIDRAVVTVMNKNGKTETSLSDGVEFPAASVAEAKRRGFDQWTVGKVMQEQGIVTVHDDPHLTLSGKSRISYLNDAMTKAVASLFSQPPHTAARRRKHEP